MKHRFPPVLFLAAINYNFNDNDKYDKLNLCNITNKDNG